MNLFGDMEDDRTSELIEAEDIEVTAHKRTRKKKQLMNVHHVS